MDEFEEIMNMAMDSLHMADVSLPKRDLNKRYAIEAPPQVTVPGYEDVAQETAGMTNVQLQERMYKKAEAEGIYTPPITVAMLKNDPTMAAASRDVYELFEGKQFQGSDADAVQYGIDVMGEFTFNFAGPVGFELSGGQSSPGGTLMQAAALIGQGDANKAQAFLYVMDQYDRLSVEAEGGFSRMFKGLLADPSNWAAAVTLGGSKILQMGGQTATKQGIKYQIRQLAKTATEKVAKYPAVAAGVGEAVRAGATEERIIGIEEEAGAEIVPEEKAARIGIASAIGGLTGAGFVKGAEVTGKGLKAGIEETVMPGIRNFVEGAEGRMAERAGSVQLGAGVDVPAAIDKAIVGAQKVFQKPTKENPVTAVAPTETEPGIIAFHGSGADFDEFKLEKIGTGEGAQAYGYGLYFTDSEDIAKFYRDAIGGSGYKKIDYSSDTHAAKSIPDIDHKEVDGYKSYSIDKANDVIKSALKMQRFNVEPDENALNIFEMTFERDGALQIDMRDGTSISLLKNFEGDSFTVTPLKKAEGKTYKVALEPKPEELLDYDLPLSQQPKMLKLIDNAYGDSEIVITQAGLDPATATGGDLIKALEGVGGQGGKRASEFLRNVGIFGIKYRAAGSRSAGVDDAAAERNYVIFDDKMIKVLEKYGIVGPVAITGVAASQQGGSETSETM